MTNDPTRGGQAMLVSLRDFIYLCPRFHLVIPLREYTSVGTGWDLVIIPSPIAIGHPPD